MNTITPSSPSGYSLFCDEVRQESNGKLFVIGLYNEGMLVDLFPAVLPIFNILITYHEKPKESDLPVEIVVTAPIEGTDKEIYRQKIDKKAFAGVVTTEYEHPMIAARMNAGFVGLPLSHPGQIKVRAYRGDDEILLGTLKIQLRSDWEAKQKLMQEKLTG